MSDSNMIDLYNERIDRMARAVEHKSNDRVPFFNAIDTYALALSDKTLNEVKDDPELEFQVYSKAYNAFKADAGMSIGISGPLAFIDALGGGIMDGSTGIPQIVTGHSEIMPSEDYDKFIEDPMKYIINNILPKKIPIFRSGSVEEKFGKYANALGKQAAFGKSRGMHIARMKQEYGFPILYSYATHMPGDYILDYLRDFKGTMNDVRRCPDKLAAACMAFLDSCFKATLALSPNPSNTQYLSMYLHLPPYLRPKDFEKIYWPSFKKYVDFFAGRGYKFLIYFEKNWEHLYDYLQDLPKNCILALFEEDDLSKAKKAIGANLCIGGGIKTNDLYYRSPQECVDVVKSLLDDVALDGGFVFATDKILLSATDAKYENLKAVTDYIAENANYSRMAGKA